MLAVLHLPDLPPGSDEQPDPAFIADLYAGRAQYELCWPEILAIAVRDGAASVHYHPWRTNAVCDNVLAYVVGGTRLGLIPPTDDAGVALLAEARRLAAPGLLARLGARISRVTVGRVRPVASSGESDWCVVCWGRGRLAGVEFLRVAAIPTVAEAAPQ